MLCKPCQALIDATQGFDGPYPEPSQLPGSAAYRGSHGVRPQTWINPTNQQYPHHPSLNALKASADHGCHLCSMVWKETCNLQLQKQEQLAAGSTTALFRELLLAPASEGVPFVQMGISFRGDGTRSQDFRLAFSYGPKAPLGSIITAIIKLYQDKEPEGQLTTRNLSSVNFSDESWATAEDWINDCFSAKHPLCQRSAKLGSWLPSRLIRVGQAADYSDIQLCETREWQPGASYITLSHCWGGLKFLTLRADSLEAFKQRIPFAELPKTFKEAISITRKFQSCFGVEYIWIDSLCIIQDSEQDWQTEAARMGEVYENSFCNLAATGSNNGQEGLILQRDPQLAVPCKARAASNETEPVRYYSCIPGADYIRNMAEAPLHRRSWVVQERLLSPRALHFAKDQLRWECSQLHASETFPAGQEGREGQLIRMSTAGLHEVLDQPIDPTTFRSQMYMIWYRILKEYTQCKLTEEKDKLVAISGIAKQIKRRVGGSDDSYKAGIWKESLLLGLLWEVQKSARDPPGTGIRPHNYRAPSWSWASVDGIISNFTFDSFLEKEQIRVMVDFVMLEATPVDDDPMGRVKDGCIRLRGNLLCGKIMVDIAGGGPHLVVRNMVVRNKPLSDDGFLSRRGLDRLHCMSFISWISKGEKWVHGLLLVPASDSPGVFARFGTFAAAGVDAEHFLRSDEREDLEYRAISKEGRFIIDVR